MKQDAGPGKLWQRYFYPKRSGKLYTLLCNFRASFGVAYIFEAFGWGASPAMAPCWVGKLMSRSDPTAKLRS